MNCARVKIRCPTPQPRMSLHQPTAKEGEPQQNSSNLNLGYSAKAHRTGHPPLHPIKRGGGRHFRAEIQTKRKTRIQPTINRNYLKGGYSFFRATSAAYLKRGYKFLPRVKILYSILKKCAFYHKPYWSGKRQRIVVICECLQMMKIPQNGLESDVIL
jgi:hypothetical protein